MVLQYVLRRQLQAAKVARSGSCVFGPLKQSSAQKRKLNTFLPLEVRTYPLWLRADGGATLAAPNGASLSRPRPRSSPPQAPLLGAGSAHTSLSHSYIGPCRPPWPSQALTTARTWSMVWGSRDPRGTELSRHCSHTGLARSCWQAGLQQPMSLSCRVARIMASFKPLSEPRKTAAGPRFTRTVDRKVIDL